MARQKTTSRPTRRTTAQLRSVILQAAREVFEEKGYAGTSTREIAERAQAAEALIFKHFDHKANLFSAAVFERVETTLDQHLEDIRSLYMESTSAYEGTRRYATTVIDTFRANKNLVLAYINAVSFHAADFAVSEVRLPQSLHFRLADIEDVGKVSPVDAQLDLKDRHMEIRLIFMFLFAVALFDDMFLEPTARDYKREIDSVVKLISMGTGLKQPDADQGDGKIERLETENRRLRQLLTDTMLELSALREKPGQIS